MRAQKNFQAGAVIISKAEGQRRAEEQASQNDLVVVFEVKVKPLRNCRAWANGVKLIGIVLTEESGAVGEQKGWKKG